MPRLFQAVPASFALLLAAMVGWTFADGEPGLEKSPSKPGAARISAHPRPSSAPKRPVGQAAGPRNYYQELFSSGEAAAKKPAAARVKAEPIKTRNTANITPKKAVPAPAVQETATDDDADLDDLDEDDGPTQAMDAQVEDVTKSENKIQQVTIQTRPRTPRIPLPPSTARVNSPASHSHAAQPLDAHFESGALSSAISLEWVKKSEFNVGQECAAELVVKNTGSSPVENVTVDAVFQTPVRVTSANPQPSDSREKLSWTFGRLAAGSEQRIAVKMIPSRRGDLGLTAQVRLTGAASAKFRVEEPLLNVALKGPEEVMLGEQATQMVVVSNPGTGAAHDVKISAEATSGLEHARANDARIEMEIGTILPGESRTIRLPLTGVKGGEQSVSVTASSSAQVSNVATAAINVISPSLAVTADGPALRYKGRNAKFTVNVTNDGSVANNNVRVVQTVAEGFQFVSADRGGKYDPDLRTVSWFVGRMESDQSIALNCELSAVQLGDFTQKVTAASDAGAKAETVVDTKVDGAASLTMELVDLDDPVEIGVETAYEIKVKNTGSKAATNVTLKCELPEGVQLLSAKGPTDAVAQRRTLTFKPLAELSPDQESVFRIHVKGLRDGNERVKALVSSDSLTEPLVQEEQTKFYSDGRR